MMRLALPVLFATSVAAQSYDISHELVGQALGEVDSFTIAPDGQRVAFRTRSGLEQSRLFVRMVDGSQPPLPLFTRNGLVQSDLRFSPDGTWIVFVFSSKEVLSVPSDGSAAARPLNAPHFAGAPGPTTFAIRSDGTRVAFLTDDLQDGILRRELFVAPIDGSAPALLVGPVTQTPGEILDFALTPDGTRAVYRTAPGAGAGIGLFSVPLDGSAAPVRLDRVRPDADVQADYVVSHDSLGVVYRHDQDADDVFELFVTRVDGSGLPLKRNAPLVLGGDVDAFALAANDVRLVYSADQDVNGQRELYGVPTFGGSAVELSGVAGVGAFALAGARAVFVRAAGAVGELHSVPLDGSAAPLALSAVGPGGEDVEDFVIGSAGTVVYRDRGATVPGALLAVPASGGAPARVLCPPSFLRPGYVLSPDEAHVMYAGREPDEAFQVHVAPTDASVAPVSLHADLASPLGELALAFTAGRALYLAPEDHYAADELYSAPVDGSAASVRLNPALPEGTPTSDVYGFAPVPDGARLVYQTFGDGFETGDLFAVSAEGGSALRVNAPLGLESMDLWSSQFVVGDERVVFSLEDGNGRHDLFSARLDGGGQVLISQNSFLNEGEVDPQLSPDGAWILYAASSDLVLTTRLMRAPSDGSAPPVELGHDRNVHRYWLAADDGRVVYTHDTAGVRELFSVPLDGSAPAVRLHPLFVAGGSVASYLEDPLDPTSTFAVYAADAEVDGRVDLYSVPIDGSVAPVRLSDGGGLPEDVQHLPLFRIVHDGSSVVYPADPDGDGGFTLHAVPITGGSAPVELGALRFAVGSDPYLVSPDSLSAVFEQRQPASGQRELVAAPLSGAPPHTLSGPLIALGAFAIAPDSARAVYLAELVAGRRQLFSAPLDGSAPAVEIGGVLVSGGDVGLGVVQASREAFQITPDGSAVVFVADARVDEVFELFVVPIDGSRAPRVVSGEQVFGGDVRASELSPPFFTLSARGDRAFYLADEEQDGVFELFGTFLGRTARRAPPPDVTRSR